MDMREEGLSFRSAHTIIGIYEVVLYFRTIVVFVWIR